MNAWEADADLGARRRRRAVTDGGVTVYECDECGEVERTNVDDSGQRRCPDCGRAVTATVTDGGRVARLTERDDTTEDNA